MVDNSRDDECPSANPSPHGIITRREFVESAQALILALGSSALLTASRPAAAAAANPSAHAGPRKVRDIENIWIPMSDGTQIAARLWLPEDAEKNPVPAIMEYIPYRKRDWTRLGDEEIHPYLASFGYACLRPDIRGSGDSGGLPQDEYVKQEQDDGLEIIAWIAKQRWCSGKVGMFGISWGGFDSLQIAARRPPALKAIITHCSTDDRYTGDAHYTGGCINECMFGWGSFWTSAGLRPPDPSVVGNRWRDEWFTRLKNLDFYVGNWLTHQHRDAFWKHGSVDQDYGDIKCAVYAVSGWIDPYHVSVPSLLANLKCPRKGLIGPWGHAYPNTDIPGWTMGPAIDWLTEALRWWDYWLKDIDTGVMKEPMYRAWMQSTPAMRRTHSVPGYWVAEESWPPARIKTSEFYLTAQGLQGTPDAETARSLKPLQTVGMTAPRWFQTGTDTELPTDQRVDDARSLCFDSAPFVENIEILGSPVVTVDLAVDKPVAFLMVRLNEVEPDGLSKRLTYGVLNLTHRNGHEFPEALEPGKRYRIRIELDHCAQVLNQGNRMRIAMSTTYWPAFWPSPEPVTLTLYAGKSQLELPVRPPRSADQQLMPFGIAFVPPTSGSTMLTAPQPRQEQFDWDIAAQKLTWEEGSDTGIYRINATGTEMSEQSHQHVQILDNDPASAAIEISKTTTFKRDDWQVRSASILRMSVTRNEFILSGDVKAYDHDQEIFAKVWQRRIPRSFM